MFSIGRPHRPTVFRFAWPLESNGPFSSRKKMLITLYLKLCADEDEHNPDFLNFGTELLLDLKIIYPVICIDCT